VTTWPTCDAILPTRYLLDHQSVLFRLGIQNEISLGSDNDALSHLGEAVSIRLLAAAGAGRLISDDHAARAIARNAKYDVRAASTVGALAALLARNEVDLATVDLYLDTLRARNRMRVGLTTTNLLAGDLGPRPEHSASETL
jgi:predicted nucleic acid-binding protein